MAKTRAEIQKAYRERKKQQGTNYLENERKRAAGNRVPAGELSKKKLKIRRAKNKIYCAKYRQSLKPKPNDNTAENVVSDNIIVQTDVIPSTSKVQDCEISSTNEPTPSTSTRASGDKIHIKFDFGQKSMPVKKRSRAIRKAKYQASKLSLKLQNQVRMTKRWQKKFERLQKKHKSSIVQVESTPAPGTPDHLTPRSKTKFDLRSAGVSPRRLPKAVVKRLEMGNSLLRELKTSRDGNHKEYDKRYVEKILCGNITRKYRCGRCFSKEVSLNRSRIWKRNTTDGITRRRRNQQKYNVLKAEVETYLERER